MDIFELAKARVMSGGGKGFYSTEENDAGGTTYTFKATESGRKSVKEKDVNFYDYDGTLLYSYTLAQAQSLKELPPLPEQEGLICQGWNWSLEDIKAHNRAVDVGATYITDDGKTRLYIKIAAEGRMDVPLHFSQTKANGVTIDWGDGSATETLSGTGKKNTVHTYASIGEYVISLDVVDGCTLGLGRGSSSYCVLGTTDTKNTVYCNMLQKVEIGTGVTSITNYAFQNCYALTSIVIPNSATSIGEYTFQNCYALTSIVIPNSATSIGRSAFVECYSLVSIIIPDGVTSIGEGAFQKCYALTGINIPNSVTSIGIRAFSECYLFKRFTIPDGATSISEKMFYICYSLGSITIPNSVTSIGSEAFYICYSLKSIVIPDSVTSIGKSAFQGCYSLTGINIPNSVTSIGEQAFSTCYSLTSITIPNSVTSIGGSAFSYCQGMKFYDFTSHTAVPTLASTNAFSSIPSDCEIRVPAALYDTWIAATNWSTYADYIVAV